MTLTYISVLTDFVILFLFYWDGCFAEWQFAQGYILVWCSYTQMTHTIWYTELIHYFVFVYCIYSDCCRVMHPVGILHCLLPIYVLFSWFHTRCKLELFYLKHFDSIACEFKGALTCMALVVDKVYLICCNSVTARLQTLNAEKTTKIIFRP